VQRPDRLSPRNEQLGDKLPFDVEKELDQVIGKFEDRRGNRMQRIGRIVGRTLLGASLAIAAATVVIYTLHSHVEQAQKAPGPKKPVQVQIVPAAK
jgi:tetrahydromethanopterin S-methyltransferase subunit G